MDVSEVRAALDAVSPTFCMAKWMTVTVHLHNGTTHSCHHPAVHKIPLGELEGNPRALHNTLYKQAQRAAMIAGSRPQECRYCWNIEDLGMMSDRVFKSRSVIKTMGDIPAIDAAREVASDPAPVPLYMEVSFSSVCNFKCSYCSPGISSRWMEEIRQHGPYPTSNRHHDLKWLGDKMPIPHRDPNPYVDAFWSWWPELVDRLKTLRITGGEPLLCEDTFTVMERLLADPRRELELAINSNLGVPDQVFDRFVRTATSLVGRVKKLSVFTSFDTHGEQAEYIRHGLEYGVVLDRVRKVLSISPDVDVTVMCTFNALSVPRFELMLDDVATIRREHGRLALDVPILMWPKHQSVDVFGGSMVSRATDILEHAKGLDTLHPMELAKIARLPALMSKSIDSSELATMRSDFYAFFSEHDRRRGTDFQATFPELAVFWEICKGAHDVNKPRDAV